MIKFECIACHQVIEAPDEMMGQQVECPACQQQFWPAKFLPMETPPVVKIETASGSQSDKKEELETIEARFISKAIADEVSRIQQLAEMFVRISKISFVLGIFFLVLTFLVTANETQTYLLAALSSIAFGLALWLYLVGQIIHIRALLSKK
jgi:hypothetical protein